MLNKNWNTVQVRFLFIIFILNYDIFFVNFIKDQLKLIFQSLILEVVCSTVSQALNGQYCQIPGAGDNELFTNWKYLRRRFCRKKIWKILGNKFCHFYKLMSLLNSEKRATPILLSVFILSRLSFLNLLVEFWIRYIIYHIFY